MAEEARKKAVAIPIILIWLAVVAFYSLSSRRPNGDLDLLVIIIIVAITGPLFGMLYLMFSYGGEAASS